MKTYGVIMAGGGGTRFWPLSRRKRPKQLLNLSGNDLMICEAYERLSLVTDEIFIVTASSQVEAMKAAMKDMKEDHILVEPSARNTSACIGYAAMEIVKKHGDGLMIVTPSDAYIRNNAEFARVLKIAAGAAEDGKHLVTVGIQPTFPATGYGYIEMEGEGEVRKVLSFREKPDVNTAAEYLYQGNYVWNSGMFLWKASTILEKFKEFLPDLYEQLLLIGESMNTPREREAISAVYPKMRSISIDYGIMEKSKDILVVPGEFGWSDVASWDMLEKLHEKDENGNVCVGSVVAVDTNDSVFYADDGLIAAVDLAGIVVAKVEGTVMVCPKEKVQDVKKLVDALKEKKMEEYL